MAKEDFINKSKNLKQTITSEENRISEINKQLSKLKLGNSENPEEKKNVLKLQHEIKELHLKVAYHYLLIYRLSEQHLSINNESSLKNIRKHLTLIIGFWEKELGKEMRPITDRNYLNLYQGIKDNQEIIKHFKLLIFLADKLLSLITPSIKWYWTALDLKVGTLISFCNVIDFRLMSRNFDPESSDYQFYFELQEIITKLAGECVDGLWQKHHHPEEKNRTILDLQLGIRILGFLISFDHLIGGKKYEQDYRKKKQVWENYRGNLIKKKESL